MEIIYVMMLVLMTGFFCVLSFLIGTITSNGKSKISLNPIEAYKEHKEMEKRTAEYNLEQRQNAAMMRNINRYDGSSLGQEDIPRE